MLDNPALHDCGCFTFEDELWMCCMHRGQTDEQRVADMAYMAWEADAMNGWNE